MTGILRTASGWFSRLNGNTRFQTGARVVSGSLGGLYISRLAAESSAGPWLACWLIPLVIICAAIGAALLAWPARRLRWQPLLLCLLYLCWPKPRPDIAFMIGLAVLVLLLFYNRPDWPRGLSFAGCISVSALVMYTITLSPSVLPADSGEFQLTSAVLGIPHPPGYALYTMLGRLFTLLPFGDAAYRVNLMSAVFSALSLGTLCWSLERHTGSRAAALAGVLLLALSPTFWAQSTSANIRSLTVLLSMLALAVLLEWGVKPQTRMLALFAFIFGLGVGHHASIALLGLPFLAYILCVAPRLVLKPGQWLPAVGAFLAALLVLLYLPIRSSMQPAFDPAPIRTWNGFWQHVLVLGFKGDLAYFRSLPELAARMRVGWQILGLQFGYPLTIASLLALALLTLRTWKTALLIGGVFLVNLLAAITYRAPQTVEYLLPAYLALAMFLAYGAAYVLSWSRVKVLPRSLLAVVFIALLANGLRSSHTAIITSRDNTTRIQAEALLHDAPENAVILTNWHQATPFWYLQTIESQRTDITIEYVYPQGATLNELVWLERIAYWSDKRPVVVTNWFYAFNTSDYRFIPLGKGWLVSATATQPLAPETLTGGVRFEPGIEMAAPQISYSDTGGERRVDVQLLWSSAGQQELDLTSFVQVLGPEGVVGQGDLRHPAAILQPGTWQTDRFELALLPHALPGNYQVIAGFYTDKDGVIQRLTSQGQDHIVIGQLELKALSRNPAPIHWLSSAWENGLRLDGYDVDDSFAGTRRLYFHISRNNLLMPVLAPPRYPGPSRLQALARDGQVLASKQLPGMEPGESIMVALDVPSGTGAIILRLFSGDETLIQPLGAWHRLSARDILVNLPRSSETFIPLANAVALTGASAESMMLQAGDEAALTARFYALQPVARDISVSLGIRSANGWEVKHDSTPAMGAVPTLKWGWGWYVKDTHLLELPEDAPPGAAVISVELYDAFTLQPVTVLDERRVREGQGTRLLLGEYQIVTESEGR